MATAKFRRRRPPPSRGKSNPNHQIDIFSGVYLMNDCCALCILVELCPVSLGSSRIFQPGGGCGWGQCGENMLSLCDRNKPEGNE